MSECLTSCEHDTYAVCKKKLIMNMIEKWKNMLSMTQWMSGELMEWWIEEK